MKVALAGRSAPAVVRSESSRPSATARPAPKPFQGQQLTIACHPLHRLRSPLSPPPPPLPLRLWPRQAGAPNPPPRPGGAPRLSQTPLRAPERRGEGPCIRPRSSVPTSSLSSAPPPTLRLRCAPPAVPTPHTTTALPRAAAVSATRPALTHKEKATGLNTGKKEKSDTLHAARRVSAPVLPPPSPERSPQHRGAHWSRVERELEPERT